MIHIRTIAYNAEQTLRQTIESVLHQTHGDFKYYLCDNGSTDNGNTRKIVEEYAKLDSRIIPFYVEKNRVWDGNMDLITLPHDIDPDDYFCILDADDEYKHTFFEEMLNFINQNNLDIAACGNDMIRAADNKLLGQRILSQNLILQDDDFKNYFSIYFQFMRTIWGKLLKGKTLRNIIMGDDSTEIPLAYGNDTFFTMRAFRDAKRVGILARSLHKYYISNKSTSYQFSFERVKSDTILHEAVLDYLKPYGILSPENESFLYQVYCSACLDTLNVILASQIPVPEKMQNIFNMLSERHIKAMLHYTIEMNSTFCIELQQTTLKWLLAQKECRNSINAQIAANIISLLFENITKTVSCDCLQYLIIKMPETIEYLIKKDYSTVMKRLNTWYKRHNRDNASLTKLELALHLQLKSPEEDLLDFMLDVIENRTVSAEELHIDEQLENILSKYPLLKNLSPHLILSFSHTVHWVMKGNYVKALEAFISRTNIEINDEDAEAYILFGQNLSSAAENANTYIYFKKVWISHLLDCSRLEEASTELAEFEQILPDDEDFIELRKMLMQI